MPKILTSTHISCLIVYLRKSIYRDVYRCWNGVFINVKLLLLTFCSPFQNEFPLDTHHARTPKQIWKEFRDIESVRERAEREQKEWEREWTWMVCKSIHCYFVYRSILFGYISRYYKNITITERTHIHTPFRDVMWCDVLWDGNLWVHIKFLIAFRVYIYTEYILSVARN